MVKEARSTPTCPLTSPPERAAAHKYRIRGSSKNWNFSDISINYKKPREAFRAPVLLFKVKKKPGLNETVMSRYEFSHWYPHYDLFLQPAQFLAQLWQRAWETERVFLCLQRVQIVLQLIPTL